MVSMSTFMQEFFRKEVVNIHEGIVSLIDHIKCNAILDVLQIKPIFPRLSRQPISPRLHDNMRSLSSFFI